MNEIFNFHVILTHVLEKKNGQILFGVEMDRRRRGYTSSGESGMESNLLRYLFFVCLVTSDNNLPITRRKNITIKMPSRDPP